MGPSEGVKFATKYATSMALSGHRSRVHGLNKAGETVNKKMFPCQHCGKLLTTNSKLQNHVKSVHEGLRAHACKFCSKRFTTNGNLKAHEAAIHTGQFPHKCHICEKGFSRKQALESHYRQNHSLAEQQPKANTVHTITMNMPEPMTSHTILVSDLDMKGDIVMS